MIELIGLPGSGKTTYAKQLMDSEALSPVILSGKVERFMGAFAFMVSNPIVSLRLFYWTIKFNKGSWKLLKHKILFLLPSSMARENKARNNSVLDEGLLQFVCAISDTELSIDEVTKLVQSLAIRNREVKLLYCSEKNRSKRLIKRNRLPRHQFGTSYINEFYTVLPKNYELFIIELSEKFELARIQTD